MLFGSTYPKYTAYAVSARVRRTSHHRRASQLPTVVALSRAIRGLGGEPVVMVRSIRVLIIAAVHRLARRSARPLEFDDQHVRIGCTNVLADM